MIATQTKTYFASDGSYGDGSDIVVIDTTDWGSEEWEIIDEAPDSERREIALQLSSR